ncbi:MAG: methyltransferase [Candidatus Melainabacteria bacterium]|nr:methyltransferase [Candidatus Melainabacteria bacterium]
MDRYYIDQFLEQHREDVRGCVLEIADNNYTKRFGGNRVDKSEILHVRENENATLIGDLVSGKGVPSETFDCIILTQTLPFIYDVKSAIANCHRAIKHVGVLLCTVNGISQISRYDMEKWGDFWRFTNLSLQQLLAESFKPYGTDSEAVTATDSEAVTVTTFGNVMTATSFLLGLPSQELQLNEMNHHDQDYQVLIGARAFKY